jgi:hypothetical protein
MVTTEPETVPVAPNPWQGATDRDTRAPRWTTNAEPITKGISEKGNKPTRAIGSKGTDPLPAPRPYATELSEGAWRPPGWRTEPPEPCWGKNPWCRHQRSDGGCKVSHTTTSEGCQNPNPCQNQAHDMHLSPPCCWNLGRKQGANLACSTSHLLLPCPYKALTRASHKTGPGPRQSPNGLVPQQIKHHQLIPQIPITTA